MTTRFKIVANHPRKPTIRESHDSLDEASAKSKSLAEAGYCVMIHREDVSLVGEYYPPTKPAGMSET